MFLTSAIVKGFIWAAAVEPMIQMLGLGSVFVAWFTPKDPKKVTEDLFKTKVRKPTKKLDAIYCKIKCLQIRD